MHKIDGAGHVNNTFVQEDALNNIPPTLITNDWLNAVQEEVVNVIEFDGGVLNKADNTQLLKKILSIAKGGDYKDSVRVASVAAINLAAPGANIDGVAMVVGDAFLEKDNATPALRGPYIWNGAAVPATRRSDADTGAELNSGAIIPVSEGTVNADTNWQLTTDGVVTIGTTGLTFANIVSGMSSVLAFSSGASTVPDASTYYLGLAYATPAITDMQLQMPYSGIIRNLFSTNPGSTSGTRTYTVMKNGVAQSLTCSCSGSVLSTWDTLNSFSFVRGDVIAIRIATSGGANTVTHRSTIEVVKTGV